MKLLNHLWMVTVELISLRIIWLSEERQVLFDVYLVCMQNLNSSKIDYRMDNYAWKIVFLVMGYDYYL